MSFQTISDVHVESNQDDRYRKLNLFLESAIINNVKEVFLLGDIFDLMVGGRKEYISYYHEFFNNLELLIKEGINIFYLQGNHDFHIKRLFQLFLKMRNLHKDSIMVLDGPIMREYNGKKFLFAHGDEIEIGNYSYKVYKILIRSILIKLLANYIVPVKWTLAIGQRASRKSRKKNIHKYKDKTEKTKIKFRESAEKAYESYGQDILICGHSHVRDEYQLKNKFIYFNNGHFPSDGCYILYVDKEIKHKKL